MFRRPAAVATLGRGYVPILLVKRGERQALAHLAERTWLGLTPWLRVVPPELRSGGDDAPPQAEMARLSRIIGDRAIYLDTAGTPRRSRRSPILGSDYVHQHLEAAAAAGLAVAPVYPFGRNDLAAVVAQFSEDFGAAVRLSPDDALTLDPQQLDTMIQHQVEVLGVDPGRLDLLIDLGYVPEGFDDPTSAIWLAKHAIASVPWRSVILAGTSVPDSLAQDIPEDSLNAIQRREAGLFAAVQTATRVKLRFGDYAVQNPVPPARGAAPTMRASIRYTSGPYMFVSRGGRPVGELRRDQLPKHYRELATRLREHPGFAGAGCCWGDQFIEDLADGRIEVRSQGNMRAVATCHHLSVIADGRPQKSFAAPLRVAAGRRHPQGRRVAHR
jgi:hypothetical protein